ncbi:hypothetical protein QN277_009431 [Acacia crassicarpa]|uniref:WRKY domain-containing protein n=1 Tax=Acacia crassicarpa TaxID=499986 RepID=A0AAE1IR49_9FABA|nr:hypothetical protein QN277_009431 [Acacia crassicarpa]
MENLTAMKELERGREFANQLRRLMISTGVDHEDDDNVKGLTTSSAKDLAAKVLDSFTNTLSLFNHHSADSSIATSSFSHLPAHSDEFHENPMTKSPTTIKDRTRSSPKKRKSAQIQTWVVESKMSPKEDGHAWRKYGEKTIVNAKHPRNYYRCIHKHDQGCEAIKHVQKIQDDPPLFRTTYFGHHTCTNPLNPHIFLDYDDLINSTSAFILSFENNNQNNNNNSLITTFDPENNNNTSSFFDSSGSLFPSSSSAKKEDHCGNNIKQEKKNNYNNYEIINVVASCSSNNECFASHPHEEEAVLPAFGSGDYDQVDVFNSAVFYDPLGGFEDLLFEII